MLSDYQTLVTDLTRDDAGKVSVAQRDAAIALAVERYSQDRPQDRVEDLVGVGTTLLALPAGWQAGFSSLKSLEHPVGRTPPAYIDQEAWSLYATPTGQQIMVLHAIAAGAAVRATYTVKHVLDALSDTIPLSHREAAAAWASALLCDQLAALYSGDTDSTIQADSVDHRSKAGEFASRARGLRKRYLDELGIDPKRNAAAGTVVNLDRTDSVGRDRLTHPRRYR